MSSNAGNTKIFLVSRARMRENRVKSIYTYFWDYKFLFLHCRSLSEYLLHNLYTSASRDIEN